VHSPFFHPGHHFAGQFITTGIQILDPHMNDAHYRLGPILNATAPDLSAFKGLGGKLILWHGWADQNIAPGNTIATTGP
jgi:hypothetical protein